MLKSVLGSRGAVNRRGITTTTNDHGLIDRTQAPDELPFI
jgi:hypothetical protein